MIRIILSFLVGVAVLATFGLVLGGFILFGIWWLGRRTLRGAR